MKTFVYQINSHTNLLIHYLSYKVKGEVVLRHRHWLNDVPTANSVYVPTINCALLLSPIKIYWTHVRSHTILIHCMSTYCRSDRPFRHDSNLHAYIACLEVICCRATLILANIVLLCIPPFLKFEVIIFNFWYTSVVIIYQYRFRHLILANSATIRLLSKSHVVVFLFKRFLSTTADRPILFESDANRHMKLQLRPLMTAQKKRRFCRAYRP